MKKAGFTLLEVIIALAILAGGILILGKSWSGNYMRVRKSTLYNNVGFLLEKKVTELEVKYAKKPIEEVDKEDSGDFSKEGYPQYSWSMKTQDFEMPDLTSMFLNKDTGANDMLLTVIRTMTEFISKSVKEMTVTVYVTSGTKKVEYSVTTYLVDYTKDLPMPGMGP